MKKTRFTLISLVAVLLFSCSGNNQKNSENTSSLINENELNNSPNQETENIESNNIVYKTYGNSRFSFEIHYPDFLIPQGESDNGDGQAFVSKDNKTRMLAYGFTNLYDDFSSNYQAATEPGYYYEENAIITYKTLGDTWFVVSGKKNNTIFYAKSVLSTNNTIVTIYFEYPYSEKGRFDDIIEYVTSHVTQANRPQV